MRSRRTRTHRPAAAQTQTTTFEDPVNLVQKVLQDSPLGLGHTIPVRHVNEWQDTSEEGGKDDWKYDSLPPKDDDLRFQLNSFRPSGNLEERQTVAIGNVTGELGFSDICSPGLDIQTLLSVAKGSNLPLDQNSKSPHVRRFTVPLWKPKNIRPDTFVVTNGKRRSGKTHVQLNILKEVRPRRTVIIAGGQDGKTFWGNYFPPIYIIPYWSEELIANFLEIQEMFHYLVTTFKDQINFNIDMAIVMTDWGFDEKVMRSKIISFIASNGRRLRILLILDAQYVKNLRPKVRQNIDLFIQFKEQALDTKKLVYGLVGGAFEDFEHMDGILRAACRDHRCVVIDNTGGGGNHTGTEDGDEEALLSMLPKPETAAASPSIFHYKADPNVPPKWIGTPTYMLLDLLFYHDARKRSWEHVLSSQTRVVEQLQQMASSRVRIAQKKGISEVLLAS